MCTKLGERGYVAATVPADLVVLEGAGHGFNGPDAEKAERSILEFLDSRLKGR